MRAAKQIVDWVRSTTIMEDLGFPSKVSVELDNSREFTLISGYGAKNKCRARPKGADQCRGGQWGNARQRSGSGSGGGGGVVWVGWRRWRVLD